MISTGQTLASSDEIPGQISGYWLAPWAEVPLARPSYRPTGAILPRSGKAAETEFTCIDLVSVEYTWLPLSEAGRYTYSHSEGLLRNEPWRFLIWHDDQPQVFKAEYDDSIEPEHVAALYGAEAAHRCRPDRPTVQLRLRLASHLS